jgi:hypothetical protein
MKRPRGAVEQPWTAGQCPADLPDLYREERLMVRRLRRKRLVRPANEERLLLRSNQEWAVDFARDVFIGAPGLGRLIGAAVLRRREFLADADAGSADPQPYWLGAGAGEDRCGSNRNVRCEPGPVPSLCRQPRETYDFVVANGHRNPPAERSCKLGDPTSVSMMNWDNWLPTPDPRLLCRV